MRPSVFVSLLSLALLAAPALCYAQQPESWATSGARSHVSLAEQNLAQGQLDAATRHYLEAISLDAGFAPAYLGLGAVRERTGDVREAERVYAEAIEHIPGFWEASLARAKLRRRLGRRDEARDDLRAALRYEASASLLELLAQWQTEDGRFLEALQTYRRLRGLLEQSADISALARTALKIKALRILVAERDVLQAANPQAGVTRRSIERIARLSSL